MSRYKIIYVIREDQDKINNVLLWPGGLDGACCQYEI
jgi:hypothetical protein